VNIIKVPLRIESWSGVLTLITALGIIFIGVRELFAPSIAASQFGVPLMESRDKDFLATVYDTNDVAWGFSKGPRTARVRLVSNVTVIVLAQNPLLGR
jgi:hypothetical protein